MGSLNCNYFSWNTNSGITWNEYFTKIPSYDEKYIYENYLNSRDAILQKTILYLKFGDSGNAKKKKKKKLPTTILILGTNCIQFYYK